jgi:PBP1b-binding outer membrane lipoprotein LpoB
MSATNRRLAERLIMMKRLTSIASAILIVALATTVLLAGCGPTGSGFTSDSTKTETSTEEYTFDSFSNIDLDLSVADIKVEQGKGYSVTVSRRNYPEVSVDVDGDTLVIADSKNSWHNTNASCNVAITVPKDAQLESVDLRPDVGSLEVNDISAAKIAATADVGEIVVSSCSAEAYILSTDTGSIELHGITDLKDASIEAKADLGIITVGGKEHSEKFSQSGTGTKIEAKTSTGSVVID